MRQSVESDTKAEGDRTTGQRDGRAGSATAERWSAGANELSLRIGSVPLSP